MKNKITLYSSPLCPDCVEIYSILKKKQVSYTDINITESMVNLKAFLKYRDTLEIFEEVRQQHYVGIPFFVIGEEGQEEYSFDTSFLK